MATWLLVFLVCVSAQDLYCGPKNCYDILELERDASKSDIRKSYRRISLIWHPDKNSDPSAIDKFREVANAYEILIDDNQRKDYDYFLEHPDEMLYNQMRFYRHRFAPKTDIRIILLVLVIAISFAQYGYWHHLYRNAINFLTQDPKYRKQLLETMGYDQDATERAIRSNKKGSLSKKEKMKQKEIEDSIIESAVQSGVVEVYGGYSKPHIADVLLAQILLLPYNFMKTCWSYARWFWLFTVLGRDYGPEEQEYLTKKMLGFSETRWRQLEEERKQELISKALWQDDNLKKFTDELIESQKEKMAGTAKYKKYKRFQKQMKNS